MEHIPLEFCVKVHSFRVTWVTSTYHALLERLRGHPNFHRSKLCEDEIALDFRDGTPGHDARESIVRMLIDPLPSPWHIAEVENGNYYPDCEIIFKPTKFVEVLLPHLHCRADLAYLILSCIFAPKLCEYNATPLAFPSPEFVTVACVDAVAASSTLTDVDDVSQAVEHSDGDPAAIISPEDAAWAQEGLWTSGVEALINGTAVSGTATADSRRLLLLTFKRLTPELDQALLCSPVALCAASRWNVQPTWANGAKVFVEMDEAALKLFLPNVILKPWHVILLDRDEDEVLAGIGHLPEPTRRLKHEVGRRVLSGPGNDSVVVNPDENRVIFDCQVRHTFVHFTNATDVRSSRSV